ncbi:UDP-glucose 4-epimerase GalE [Mycoplasma sp. Mirounga ES2805-ORL]|uniref:UDP-glucose 4-epimerase GalE n=1 Tax=Mycoplasma sp. Mirounga ES2805-ORL TaxID=754514 RepID=UPI00197BA8CD|nr:UDP-glucose 4-epimerase GalE [Mycoplasma sp. Mirounga ES2805-ORL]QSF13945.1 UDP-glucose 4-epimerase GalE [Mycoplasma sp. Mirounga ES2805-ORL]
MTYLLIGGAGYIGSHIKEQLLAKNEKVIIFDNFSTGFKEFTKGAKVYKGDFTNLNSLEAVFKKQKIDVVILLAAKIAVGESVQKPLDYYNNNIIGALNTLKCIQKYNVKKLIFSSTAATYGLGEGKPLKETDEQKPINPYGAGKLVVETMIKDLARVHDFKYIIFRYFNVAGASDSLQIGYLTKDQSKVNHIIPAISSSYFHITDKLKIFGNDYNTPDGTCVRDYIHVVDLARAHIEAVKYLDNNNSNIFNVGSKKGYSVKQIVDAFEKANNIKIDYEYGRRRPGDPDLLIADSSKIAKEMNFQNKYGIDEIVKSEFEWRNKIFNNKNKISRAILKEPVVTLLVPVYNAKSYFEKTLLSILNQNENNFKVVICDDSSTDGTYDFVKSKVANDPRFKVIKTDKNLGLGAVRDILISHCDTKYFMFLDDDDYLYKNAIYKMSRKALKTNSDILTSKYTFKFSKKSGEYTILPPLYNYTNITSGTKFLTYNIVYFWGNFIKKSYFDSLNLKIGTRLYEDIAPVTKIFINAKTFTHVNVFGIRYFRRDNSLSSFNDNNLSNKLKYLNEAYKKALEYVDSDVCDEKDKTLLIDAKFYNWLALLVLFHRKISDSLKVKIVEYVKEYILPLAKKYNWKPKISIHAWKIFVNSCKPIINLFKNNGN